MPNQPLQRRIRPRIPMAPLSHRLWPVAHHGQPVRPAVGRRLRTHDAETVRIHAVRQFSHIDGNGW